MMKNDSPPKIFRKCPPLIPVIGILPSLFILIPYWLDADTYLVFIGWGVMILVELGLCFLAKKWGLIKFWNDFLASEQNSPPAIEEAGERQSQKTLQEDRR